jgi:RecG-like helicase
LRALPFDLTNAQARVIEELRGDLGSTFPMNRLLQGDVGSGKTVVAIAAMLLAVEAGFQAALMAPTQILAEQHHAFLRRWLEPLGVPISLRTGARKEDPLPLFANTPRLNPGITGGPPVASGGSPDASSDVRYGKRRWSASDPQTEAASHHRPAGQIFVGTHALLYEPDGLENPG